MNELPLLKPMLAKAASPFDSKDYIFEVKWDGYRALVYLEDGIRLISRSGKNLTKTFPELDIIYSRVLGSPVLLDGEIVVFQEGKPSFNLLQKRGRLMEEEKIKSAAAKYPAIYMVFDVLYFQGRNIMGYPLMKRKEILNMNLKPGENVLISDYIKEKGVRFVESCRKEGLEGVMAKNVESLYFPGKRTGYWKKIRNVKEADLVICGYQPGKGRRRLGALILGGYKLNKLIYQGKVGAGFSVEEENLILNFLEGLSIQKPPLEIPAREMSNAIWVKPDLVCTVKYLALTSEGLLRHPVYKGLRKDKKPEDCTFLLSIP